MSVAPPSPQASASAPTIRRRVRVWRGIGLAFAILVAVIIASRFLPGAVTGPALVTSVGRTYSSTFTGCTGEVNGLRTCAVTGSAGSASDHVDVTLRGRCWAAKRVYSGRSQPSAPERAEGCILLADNLRLFDRLLFMGKPVDDLPRLLRDP